MTPTDPTPVPSLSDAITAWEAADQQLTSDDAAKANADAKATAALAVQTAANAQDAGSIAAYNAAIDTVIAAANAAKRT